MRTESDFEFMSGYILLICIIQRLAKKNESLPSKRATLTYRASPQKTSKREIYFSAEGKHCSRKRLTLQVRRHDLHYMNWSLDSSESVMGGIFRSKDEIHFSWV